MDAMAALSVIPWDTKGQEVRSSFISLTLPSYPDTAVYLRKNGKICTDPWLADETR